MNEALFEYDYTIHYDPYISQDWNFKEKVNYGWKLVTVVRKDKENYIAYWEKPTDDE